jgi:inosine-uridine nucleoside N-ribohydrolase
VDDLLAIAFLVTQSSVTIEAITVVNGLAHVNPGAHNILRLLQIVNRTDIPVYEGATQHFPGGHDFDADWRKTADTLPGVQLPGTTAAPQEDAIGYLATRFADASNPFTLLALGPHTNLASALAKAGGSYAGISRMVMMGGAVFVAGNVNQDGNTSAEWNMYGDPQAASDVFTSGLSFSMVPLDATSQVPIGQSFLDAAGKLTSALGQAVFQLLTLGYTSNDGSYYAWDPLAAVTLVAPSIVTGSPQGIELVTTPPQAGRTEPVSASAYKMTVATTADASAFQSTFLGAF